MGKYEAVKVPEHGKMKSALAFDSHQSEPKFQKTTSTFQLSIPSPVKGEY